VQQASNTPPTAPPHIVWSSTASVLQQLRRKAEERNPDEFYFGMEKARTADGVHVQRSTEANKYSQDELRLMKTQDVNYLTLKAQAESKVCRPSKNAAHAALHSCPCFGRTFSTGTHPVFCRKWSACSNRCTSLVHQHLINTLFLWMTRRRRNDLIPRATLTLPLSFSTARTTGLGWRS
jgi:hypothetical protein